MQLIFVHATEPKLSYSLNEGASFTTVTLDPSTLDPVSVKYHPTRNDWMMMQDEDNSVGLSLSLSLFSLFSLSLSLFSLSLSLSTHSPVIIIIMHNLV